MAALPDGRLVIHRIEEIGSGRARLRGDTCRDADPPISVDEVVAMVDPSPRPAWRALPYRLVSR
jgi:hypothetical protein